MQQTVVADNSKLIMLGVVVYFQPWHIMLILLFQECNSIWIIIYCEHFRVDTWK